MTVLTQVVGVVASAGFFAVASGHGWAWADQMAATVDVGFSAGALGVAAAATATLPLPWRGRARALRGLLLRLTDVRAGEIWDLEHLVGVTLGLALGPVLLGRRIVLHPPALSTRETRLLAASAFGFSAVASLVSSFTGAGGPLATGLDASPSPTPGLVAALVWMLIANGLRTGSRLGWLSAVTLTSVLLVGLALVAERLAVTDNPGWPLTVYSMLVTLAQLAIVVRGRRSFGNPVRGRARRLSRRAMAGPVDDEPGSYRLGAERGRQREQPGQRMTTWQENQTYVSGRAGGGVVAYRSHAGVAIGLLDPVAPTATATARSCWRSSQVLCRPPAWCRACSR